MTGTESLNACLRWLRCRIRHEWEIDYARTVCVRCGKEMK